MTTEALVQSSSDLAVRAAAGDAEAQFLLGCEYRDRPHSDANKAEAFRWFKAAADQGHLRAIGDLARCYYNGWGTQKDGAEAVRLARIAADQGDAGGQTTLGVCYEYGTGVEKSIDQAVAWYRKAADQGDARAQTNLGVCYEYGTGVEKSIDQAVAWYRKAADQGNARAQTNLGHCYLNGKSFKKSDESDQKAIELFRLAAESGNAAAQANIGYCYEFGRGVSRSDEEAFHWYKVASGNGSAWAMNKVGDCYYNGKGVKKDDSLAEKYYKMAIEADAQPYMCIDLAQLYALSDQAAEKYDEIERLVHRAVDLGANPVYLDLVKVPKVVFVKTSIGSRTTGSYIESIRTDHQGRVTGGGGTAYYTTDTMNVHVDFTRYKNIEYGFSVVGHGRYFGVQENNKETVRASGCVGDRSDVGRLIINELLSRGDGKIFRHKTSIDVDNEIRKNEESGCVKIFVSILAIAAIVTILSALFMHYLADVVW